MWVWGTGVECRINVRGFALDIAPAPEHGEHPGPGRVVLLPERWGEQVRERTLSLPRMYTGRGYDFGGKAGVNWRERAARGQSAIGSTGTQ